VPRKHPHAAHAPGGAAGTTSGLLASTHELLGDLNGKVREDAGCTCSLEGHERFHHNLVLIKGTSLDGNRIRASPGTGTEERLRDEEMPPVLQT